MFTAMALLSSTLSGAKSLNTVVTHVRISRVTVESCFWPTSRFGNNLFQYVFARLFAQAHGLRMVTPFAPANGGDIVTVLPSDAGETVTAPVIRVTDDPWIC